MIPHVWERVEAQRTAPHSLEVSRTSKGDYSWTVKAYADTETLDLLPTVIAGIDAELRARFLMAPSAPSI